MHRPSKGPARRFASSRRTLPDFDSLEGRALMSVSSSAYYPNGSEVIDVVYPNSTLYQYNNLGQSTNLGNNVSSASVAIDLNGNQIQDVVFNNGSLYQYDSIGVHYLGNNVKDVSAAFLRVLSSEEIQDVVFNDGNLYEYDALGAHYLGNKVDSDGVADYVTGNGTPSNPYHESLSHVIVFGNGADYHYDVAGPKLLGQLFIPSPAAITTVSQPASAAVGTSITDTATVTGGDYPTGTVTFNLYSDVNGTGTPLFTDANVPLSGGTATSTGYTTAAPGTDYWVATYNGDSNNGLVTSGAPSGQVTITSDSPPAGLDAAYSGHLFDTAQSSSYPVAISSTFFLANIVASTDGQGDNVAGTLTITDFGKGNNQVNENFVGIYSKKGALPELKIRNASPNDPTLFNFDFQINPSGSLYVEHSTDVTYVLAGGFSIDDTNIGLTDKLVGQPSDYAILAPG